MTKEINNLKFYHIILISMLISPLLVLNSNLNNKQREKERSIRKELNNVFLRKLDFKEDTNLICNKGSDELKDYYKTGDEEKIGIKKGKIENKDKSEHTNALINLVSSEGDTMDNAKTYAMHVIPVLVFLVITIFSLPGWLICCFCNCCDCCCCCCCKKTSCKVPFYILTVAIYALVAAICVYGLSQSNSIFVGLADTECSLLRFTGEVLDGETKETKPKWIGINEIQKLFGDTKREINNLNNEKQLELNHAKELIEDAKSAFEGSLETQSGYINDNSHKVDNYKLDIIKKFGSFSKDGDGTITITPEENDILVYAWYSEYKTTADQANNYMTIIDDNYDQLKGNSAAMEALDNGVKSINDIKKTFDGVKDQISGVILEYSDMIDEYGKLAFKLIFSVLLIIDLAIAAFITLLCFCSFQACQNCCIRCILKSFLHILWNVLALLTFFTLLIGSIFTLFGTVGKDLISVVEYLVSDKNLDKPEPILLADAAQYLKKCVNGDGDINEQLQLNVDSLENVDLLNTAIVNIDKIIAEVQDIKSGKKGKIAYNAYNNLYTDRINYKSDFAILGEGNAIMSFSDTLNTLNQVQTKIKWSNSCVSQTPFKLCSEDFSTVGENSHTCVDLKGCTTDKITGISGTVGQDLNTFVSIINLEKDDTNSKSLAKVLNELNSAYNAFLDAEKANLLTYRDAISSLTGIFDNLLGDGNLFSLLNCLFIGRNVKILLKTLEKSLGTNFYTVGICLVIAGIAMLISISFTILLNIIFNQKDTKPGMPGMKQ